MQAGDTDECELGMVVVCDVHYRYGIYVQDLTQDTHLKKFFEGGVEEHTRE